MCPECDSDGRGTTCAPYNMKVNYLEMMRTAGDCHKQCESQQEYAKVKFKLFRRILDVVKTSSEKEIIFILVSDTGAHIVRAPGKMKTTFHLRNTFEVSRINIS